MTERGFLIGGHNRTIEADEAFIGGKIRGGRSMRLKNKTAIVALVERGKKGEARAIPVADVSADTLRKVLSENVHDASAIHTDGWKGYMGIEEIFKGGHESVNHEDGEYVRKINTGKPGRRHMITSNSVESYWALLKRGIHGSFHHVSRKHLHRYANEFSFRWSHKTESDADRAIKAICGAEGKRLTYA